MVIVVVVIKAVVALAAKRLGCLFPEDDGHHLKSLAADSAVGGGQRVDTCTGTCTIGAPHR